MKPTLASSRSDRVVIMDCRHLMFTVSSLWVIINLLASPAASQPPAPPSPRDTAAGKYLPLPDREKISQLLPPSLRQIYTFKVPAGGNVSITVFPCEGHVSWNITYVGARVFSHPRYPTGKKRKKRCCVTGGVTHNFNFNIAGLPSGLGTSMGDGAITYFLEDTSGGTYYIPLINNSPTVARYEIFATLRPAISPYIHLPNDPQLKVTAIRQTELGIAWMPVRGEPWGPRDVLYCVEFHDARTRVPDDVRSSTCAAHRYRPATRQDGCMSRTNYTIRNLQPSTRYVIEVFGKNRVTNTETAYLSVTATTAAGVTVPVQNIAQRATIPPLETRVFTMTVPQVSAMLMGVSPCSGQLKWSVLDSSGRSVRNYFPPNTPGMQVLSPNALIPRRTVGSGSPHHFVNSLPSGDQQYQTLMRPGTKVSIAVSNVNRYETSSFEVYAASNNYMTGYPQMPGDRQLTPSHVTGTSMSLSWLPVLISLNITYCLHVFPHNQAVRNKVVHSACGISMAQQRRDIVGGQCMPVTKRTITGLTPNTWYDVDVIARNTFTKQHQAYSGLLAFTGGSVSRKLSNRGMFEMRFSSASCRSSSSVVLALSLALILWSKALL